MTGPGHAAYPPDLALTGRHVRLVPLALVHLAPLSAIGLDPALWRHTIIRLETPGDMRRHVEAALAARAAGTAVPFAITLAGTGDVVGTTRFQGLAPAHRRAEIGVTWIGVPWQRTVVNTEAKYLMLRHAFDREGMQRVEFKADSQNEPSRRALTRIGATFEGTLRRYMVSPHRGARDIALFSIIDVEWPAVKAALESRLAADAPNLPLRPASTAGDGDPR